VNYDTEVQPLTRQPIPTCSTPTPGFAFACPLCHARLQTRARDERFCPVHERPFRRIDGIWRFLVPERLGYFQRFMREYETVRRAEGRGSEDAAYYRALPFQDRSGNFEDDWRIRAKSFQALVRWVIQPLEEGGSKPLRALDLGAGNGWLSYRLAQRSHHVAAVDLATNRMDGLGAYVHYDASFVPIQAEFDCLPLLGGQADLVVFNGSLHYAIDYRTTLAEALRVLRAGGRLVIMDSPVYHDARSGKEMVRERERRFAGTYGFPSNAIPSENYITYDRLNQLAHDLKLNWRLIQPWYGWRWALRPWMARVRRRREPAQFLLAVGERRS
jgi:SAM-dependent methyltransferase